MSESDVEDTLKRMENHSSVIGTVIVNAQGIPIRSTLNNSTTVQFAGLLRDLSAMARSMVKDIDPQNDLTFLRICSNNNEIMVGLDNDYLLIVIQKLYE